MHLRQTLCSQIEIIGIGGASAAVMLARQGHEVTLLEAAQKVILLTESRTLIRWLLAIGIGLAEEIEERSVTLHTIAARRWENGAALHSTPIDGKPSNLPKTIHRADLHAIIVNAAQAMPNMHLRLGSKVTDFDFDNAVAGLADGTRIIADILIAAGGIKSLGRKQLLESIGEQELTAEPTGDATYRIMIPRNKMLDDPQLRELIESTTATRWVGPGRHVTAYPIRNHELFNVVLIHPDRGDKDKAWISAGNRGDMIRDYEGWDPIIRKLIDRAPSGETLEWKLCTHKPLSTWIRGKGALMGDASHPMLPYVAQGAAQAVEAAACLSYILSNLTEYDQIPLALRAYELSRKPRAEIVQEFGLANRVILHLPDGQAQIQRDEAYRHVEFGGPSPDKWLDEITQRFLWDWDAEAAGMHSWLLNSSSLLLNAKME
ncbi:hypothetical protein KEM54_006741 [Ascosphaera aggregata]|nr:hypothetical protein KEM54_006741 [Ascosphaera aggregata]